MAHMKDAHRLAWALVFVFAVVVLISSLPESSFELASESRLPKWITLPPGLTRANVSLTMSYYSFPWGRAQFILRDAHEHVIEKRYGKQPCSEPLELKNAPHADHYPAYEVVTVKGVTEIMEHRKMEPIFYVTDDPAVWKQYSAIGCR